MSLLPSLPDDLALECLLRAPRASHQAMRSVSREWRCLLKSDDFFDRRVAMGLAEPWAYFCGDVSKAGDSKMTLVACDMRGGVVDREGQPLCMDTREVPASFARVGWFRHLCCVTVGRVIYLISGIGNFTRVLAYDPIRCEYKTCAHLPSGGMQRCAVIDGRIFCRQPARDSVLVYDPTDDTWQRLPNGERGNGYIGFLPTGLAFNGRFYAEAVEEDDNCYVVRCFDPNTGAWSDGEPQLNRLARGPSVAIGLDSICMMEQRNYPLTSRVMLYHTETDSWHRLHYLPPCSSVAIVPVGSTVYILWNNESEGGCVYYTVISQAEEDSGDVDDETVEWKDFWNCPKQSLLDSVLRNVHFCGTIAL